MATVRQELALRSCSQLSSRLVCSLGARGAGSSTVRVSVPAPGGTSRVSTRLEHPGGQASRALVAQRDEGVLPDTVSDFGNPVVGNVPTNHRALQEMDVVQAVSYACCIVQVLYGAVTVIAPVRIHHADSGACGAVMDTVTGQ